MDNIEQANIDAHALAQIYKPLDKDFITKTVRENAKLLGLNREIDIEFFPSPSAAHAEFAKHNVSPPPCFIHGLREFDVRMYCRDQITEGKLTDKESIDRLNVLNTLADASYPIYLFDNEMVFVERPVKHHWDPAPEGTLPTVRHNATGPAIEFSDGTGLYYWHGTPVPEWVINDKHEAFNGLTTAQIDNRRIELALSHNNAEIRRCALEKVGFEKALSFATLVAEDKTYGKLYLLGGLRLLSVTNGSPELDGTYRQYVLLARPPQIAPEPNVLEEVAAGYGVSVETYLSASCRT